MSAALEALRAALAAGITPLPWAQNECRLESEREHGWANDGWIIAGFEGPDARANAAYIAAACNAAPELLAEVDRLKAERDALRAVVREVVDYFDAPDEGCFSDEAMERARAALKEQA